MTKQTSSRPAQDDQDPWAAFGYLVAGVAFYGVLGWLLGRWLNAGYLLPVGIVVGLLFGMYMVFARYRFREDPSAGGSSTASRTPIDHDTSAEGRTGRDDRGDR